jgi:formate dehydrogenase iron-sulfur subunit
MTTTVYVPCDSAAVSLGADRVAAKIVEEAQKRNIAITLIRNGSRGLFWLEPLVEIATDKGRMAYGPVQVSDVAALFDANFLTGGTHPLALGLTEEITYLSKQQRLTFARVGITDPVSLDDYLAHDGYRGLKNAIAMTGTSPIQACGVAVVRPFLPELSGIPCLIRHRNKNISSAMPTKVIPVRIQTV